MPLAEIDVAECTNLIPITTNIFYEDGSEICLNCQINGLTPAQQNSILRLRYNLEYINPEGIQRAVLEVQVKGQANPPKAGVTYNELVFEVSYVKVIEYLLNIKNDVWKYI